LNDLYDGQKKVWRLSAEGDERLSKLQSGKAVVHNLLEETLEAITSCDKIKTESGAVWQQLTGLHVPRMAIQGSVYNHISFATGLKQKSGFSERLVLEFRVLKLVNEATALRA
jgi:hypothetical protein